jgi:hypothetical protein
LLLYALSLESKTKAGLKGGKEFMKKYDEMYVGDRKERRIVVDALAKESTWERLPERAFQRNQHDRGKGRWYYSAYNAVPDNISIGEAPRYSTTFIQACNRECSSR